MCSEDPHVLVNENQVQNVKEHAYLGQIVTLGKNNKEI